MPKVPGAPVQIFEQRSRAGSQDREKTRLAGQGLWFVSDGLADIARDRSGEHDRSGESTEGGEG